MDEQMVDKRYTESEQYAKAVKTGERIGTRLNRLRDMLQRTKVPVAPARRRPA